ncbi:hypothetical protein ColTof3_04333 [Colletotrichum tofieldiae]|nr:hypothetical protein ColTof3_04333 [Colletotrichum tofieldiae]
MSCADGHTNPRSSSHQGAGIRRAKPPRMPASATRIKPTARPSPPPIVDRERHPPPTVDHHQAFELLPTAAIKGGGEPNHTSARSPTFLTSDTGFKVDNFGCGQGALLPSG